MTKTLQKLKLTFLLKLTLNGITKANLQEFCSKSQYFLKYWVSKCQNWKNFFWKICNILPRNQYFLLYEVSIYQDWQISLEKVAKLLHFSTKISKFSCFLGCGSARGTLPDWKLDFNESLWANLSNESNFQTGKVPRAEILKISFLYILKF